MNEQPNQRNPHVNDDGTVNDHFEYKKWQDDAKMYVDHFDRYKDAIRPSRPEVNYIDYSSNLIDKLEPFASDSYFSTSEHSLSFRGGVLGFCDSPRNIVYSQNVTGITPPEVQETIRSLYDRYRPTIFQRLKKRIF